MAEKANFSQSVKVHDLCEIGKFVRNEILVNFLGVVLQKNRVEQVSAKRCGKVSCSSVLVGDLSLEYFKVTFWEETSLWVNYLRIGDVALFKCMKVSRWKHKPCVSTVSQRISSVEILVRKESVYRNVGHPIISKAMKLHETFSPRLLHNSSQLERYSSQDVITPLSQLQVQNNYMNHISVNISVFVSKFIEQTCSSHIFHVKDSSARRSTKVFIWADISPHAFQVSLALRTRQNVVIHGMCPEYKQGVLSLHSTASCFIEFPQHASLASSTCLESQSTQSASLPVFSCLIQLECAAVNSRCAFSGRVVDIWMAGQQNNPLQVTDLVFLACNTCEGELIPDLSGIVRCSECPAPWSKDAARDLSRWVYKELFISLGENEENCCKTSISVQLCESQVKQLFAGIPAKNLAFPAKTLETYGVDIAAEIKALLLDLVQSQLILHIEKNSAGYHLCGIGPC